MPASADNCAGAQMPELHEHSGVLIIYLETQPHDVWGVHTANNCTSLTVKSQYFMLYFQQEAFCNEISKDISC